MVTNEQRSLTYCVTVWFKTDSERGSIEADLLAATGRDPHERFEDNGLCDMKWNADSMEEALALGDRLKPFVEDDSLVLLRVLHYSGNGVRIITHKDNRSSL